MIIIKNAKIITPERIIHGELAIKDRKIIEIKDNGHININKNDNVIDAKGDYVSPGFIDIHTHGGGGHDFMDGTIEALIEGSKAHLPYGTTTIVPTTLTSTKENLFSTLDNMRELKKSSYKGPNILGLHLEGPYFAYEQRGAQDPKYIRDPDRDEYMEILKYKDVIVRWTIAPERNGAMELAQELRELDIVCSIGHSQAVYEDVQKAFEVGCTLVTHLYSGMSMVRRINAYRYAGIVESSYLIDDMFVEVIGDGIHLPSSLLKLIYKIKGPDKICLVTDSMRAAGMPEGKYILGNIDTGQEIIVEDGVAKLKSRESFAGSVATADRVVRTMMKFAEIPIHEAVKMMTYTPAKVMGIDKNKGSIAIGKDADILIFNNNIDINRVLIGGEELWNSKLN
ncbi:N-acetylglucosamine-6-phosphate deacetylase [Virgibacillus sp. W0430]|uniref:N-acetylglucosamine-6-phosphate deacetylase n=1 Tax=Virgibacillus sp. W0430 TaxID=3391580 RepID=UPI003F4576B9